MSDCYNYSMFCKPEAKLTLDELLKDYSTDELLAYVCEKVVEEAPNEQEILSVALKGAFSIASLAVVKY